MGTKRDSREQQARNMLERMGVADAQSFTCGDVVELANLISQCGQLRHTLHHGRTGEVTEVNQNVRDWVRQLQARATTAEDRSAKAITKLSIMTADCHRAQERCIHYEIEKAHDKEQVVAATSRCTQLQEHLTLTSSNADVAGYHANERCTQLQEQLDTMQKGFLASEAKVVKLERTLAEANQKLSDATKHQHAWSQNAFDSRFITCVTCGEFKFRDGPPAPDDHRVATHPDGRPVTQQEWDTEKNQAIAQKDIAAVERKRVDSWCTAARDLARHLGLADDESKGSHRDFEWITRFALNYQHVRSHRISETPMAYDRLVEAARKDAV